jgi:hypothetical protein
MTAIDLIAPTLSRSQRAPVATAIRVGAETVVCASCGCRLTTRDAAQAAGVGGSRDWYHFSGAAGRDARGCAVACAEVAHRVG